MPQPNQGSAGTPHVSAPWTKDDKPKPQGEVQFGAPGGAGTKGTNKGAK